jgi:hypothetical protein
MIRSQQLEKGKSEEKLIAIPVISETGLTSVTFHAEVSTVMAAIHRELKDRRTEYPKLFSVKER